MAARRVPSLPASPDAGRAAIRHPLGQDHYPTISGTFTACTVRRRCLWLTNLAFHWPGLGI